MLFIRARIGATRKSAAKLQKIYEVDVAVRQLFVKKRRKTK